MTFHSPYFLALLLLLPLLVGRELNRLKTKSGLTVMSYPGLDRFARENLPLTVRLRGLPFYLKVAGMAFFVIALARPQTGFELREVTTKGIDIVLALDVSSSMSVTDLRPTRLDAAKKVLESFVEGRVNDRIGVVVFAGESYTQCPLTLDYKLIGELIRDVDIGTVDDGTAIGSAIITSAGRLKKSDAASKIVILLTDGVNNRGSIDPATAAKTARTEGIKIYAVGVGRKGIFYQNVRDNAGNIRQVPTQTEIDEDLLKTVAAETGGRYFRATDEKSLEAIYAEIDRLEKTEIKTNIHTRYTEHYLVPLVIALILYFAAIALERTRLRRIP